MSRDNIFTISDVSQDANSPHDFDLIFTTLVQQQTDALLISGDPFFSERRDELVALAAHHTVPAITNGESSSRRVA
jgi:hypothetical protein